MRQSDPLNDREEWPVLAKDSFVDAAVRFVGGAILGLVIALAGLLGTSLLGLPFLSLYLYPQGVPVVVVGLPLLFGILSVVGGNRALERLLQILRRSP